MEVSVPVQWYCNRKIEVVAKNEDEAIEKADAIFQVDPDIGEDFEEFTCEPQACLKENNLYEVFFEWRCFSRGTIDVPEEYCDSETSIADYVFYCEEDLQTQVNLTPYYDSYTFSVDAYSCIENMYGEAIEDMYFEKPNDGRGSIFFEPY